MKFRWLGLGAAMAMVSLACSSSDPGPKYPDVASFCSQWATEECQVASRCASSASTCQSARQADCQTFASAATTGSRTYTAVNGESCINKIHDIYSGAAGGSSITPTQMSDMAEVCNRAFSGTVGSLKACGDSYDCADGLICDKGLCANSVTKNQGDLCGNPGEICAAGSYCALNGAVSQCGAKGAQGAACSATLPCTESLRCDNTCGPLFSAGAACASSADCASDAPYCDPNVGNKCDSGLTFAAGAPACKAYGG
ncbi:MAG: hypothetical protein ABI461_10410 [Polyangiaceae bacterium]